MKLDVFQYIYIGSNLFLIYVIFQYCKLFYEEDALDVPWIRPMLAVAYYGVSTLLHLYFSNPILNVVNNLLFIFLISMTYIASYKQRIYNTLLIFLLMGLVDLISFKGSRLLSLQKVEYWGSFVNVLIFISLLLILRKRKFLTQQKKTFIHHNYLSVLFMMGLSIGLIVYLGMQITDVKLSLLIAIFFICVLNFIFLTLYENMEEGYEEEKELLYIKSSIQNYLEQIQREQQEREEQRNLYHDLKHHLLTIQTLVTQNQAEQANSYIDQLLPIFRGIPTQNYCADDLVNGILNYKVKEAQKKNIAIQMQIDIDATLAINRFDLTIILGNILDNAIEAAFSSESKKVIVELYTEKGLLFFRVKNSYSGLLQRQGDEYLTTKSDTENHGRGLRNVRKVLEKYQGRMAIEQSADQFKVNILMYNEACR